MNSASASIPLIQQKGSSQSKIIVALDVETVSQARQIINEIGNQAGAYKVGLQLFTAAGAEFVRELTAAGIKVFLDLKFHDIPNTVAKASIEAARLGVWMFNLHAAGGSEMLHQATTEVREMCERENLPQPKIIAVTVLTSSNQAVLKETGVDDAIESQVLRLAALAEKSNLDGVVAAPPEIELIRRAAKKNDFLIVTPGIRNKTDLVGTGTIDDQKRVMTAGEAINQGADYVVIGRPITKAPDPLAALHKIIEEINGN